MSKSDTEESDSGVPWAVRPGEVAALVAAYRRAQVAEAGVRQLLDAHGIPADIALTVATLDSRGRPAVRLTLRADNSARLTAAIRQLCTPQSIHNS